MTTLTHNDARSLLNLALDARLSGAERRALDEHLAGCESCAAYAADLQRLNAHLFESLQARWADSGMSALEMDRGLRLTGQRVRQRSTGRRLMLVAQPVAWTLGAIALVAVMAGVINAITPKPTQTPAPTVPAGTLSATPETVINPTVEGDPLTATRGICEAQVNETTELRKGPNAGYVSERTVFEGMKGQVLSIYYENPDTPWLQVYFKETSNVGYVGWLLASSVTPTGDCGSIIQYVPTSTPDPATATPQPPTSDSAANSGGATATPTPVGVCFVAPGDYGPPDLNIYEGPSAFYAILSTLEIGQWVKATGIFNREGYPNFVRVEHQGLVGWVDASLYMFDGRGTEGCWPLEQVVVDPLPPTPQPTSTLLPTATVDPGVNAIIYITPENPSGSFSAQLPLGDGSTSTLIGIRANNIAPGDDFHMTVLLTCSGETTDHLRWDYYGLPVTLNRTCGMTMGTPVSQSDNFRTIIVALPNGGSPVGFTVTVTLGD